ncbi:MAG: SRPBCC domain-containing protein [Azospirillaceae bacterium]|nr:SRPBCC domain-containing protein [Azospirillaceae bacterium]
MRGPVPEFRLSRTFHAGMGLLWQAFTEPERLRLWWGPKGFTWVLGEMDLRPGGTFLYGMQPPGGLGAAFTMWGKWTFREITPPTRNAAGEVTPGHLAFLASFTDAGGTPIRHPMNPTWPLEVLSTVSLVKEGPGRTRVDSTGVPFEATVEEQATFAAGLEGMRLGFSGTWDQLADYLTRIQGPPA